MPRYTTETLEEEVRAALERMRRHRMIVSGPRGWQPADGEEDVLAYYARSIESHVPIREAAAE
jgi:chromosome condensin MukBEF MukE localization factor